MKLKEVIVVCLLRGVLVLLVVAVVGRVDAATLEFELMTWDDSVASAELPSAAGVKPGQSSQPCDWLVFSGDDYSYSSGWNPYGALSHNIADPGGDGGSQFVMAPSLTCQVPFTIEFTPAGERCWDVKVTAQAYTGYATSFAQMNQFLVSEGDPATQDEQYVVDGIPNEGVWLASSESEWSISYVIDFYLATNTDGNGDPLDIDAAFDDCLQAGYLIPVSEVTSAGLDEVELDDPAGFYDGDFKLYLIDEIVPRLPAGATALLITQMSKSHPVFTDFDVSITQNSLVGNTTIAYTMDPLPNPCDIDGDGDVDLSDVDVLVGCLSGPGVDAVSECSVADLDGDASVDLYDFSLVQQCFVDAPGCLESRFVAR